MLAKFSLFSPLLYIPTVLAAAGTLQQVTGNFGSNPTNVGFYIYVPSKLQPKPPIVVNPHWCQGSAQAAFAGSQTASLADTYGYIVIYPDSPHTDGKCWDVSSTQTLTHNGGGDSLGIVSMVKYTLAKYNGDASRVFAWGVSSGAMMTNVLLGSYPDIFAAGSAWAGVAFGCFAGNGYDVWNDDCAKGRTIKTGAEWKVIVTAAYPGYTGFRPKLQVFHGSADTVLYPQNLQEEIKEWTAVLGLPSSPVSTISNSPSNGWTTSVYGDKFQATLASGVSHDIQPIFSVVLAWFDLNCTTGCYSHGSGGSTGGGPGGDPGTSTVRPTTSTSTKAPPTTTITNSQGGTWPQTTPGATGENLVSHYGQCGGDGYTGWTVCDPSFTCKYFNQWYSQCL